MPTLRLILGDQLSKTISSLRDCDVASSVPWERVASRPPCKKCRRRPLGK